MSPSTVRAPPAQTEEQSDGARSVSLTCRLAWGVPCATDLREFKAAAGVPVYGEVTSGNYSYLYDFIQKKEDAPSALDAVTHFNLFGSLRSGFCGVGLGFEDDTTQSTGIMPGSADGETQVSPPNLDVLRLAIEEHLMPEQYDTDRRAYLDLLGHFLDTHDEPRFARACAGQQSRVQHAITALMMLPGLPIVYYGTEQLFAQQNNRAALWSSNFSSTPTYDLIAQLNLVRKTHLAGRGIPLRIAWTTATSIVLVRGGIAPWKPVTPLDDEDIICMDGGPPVTDNIADSSGFGGSSSGSSGKGKSRSSGKGQSSSTSVGDGDAPELWIFVNNNGHDERPIEYCSPMERMPALPPAGQEWYDVLSGRAAEYSSHTGCFVAANGRPAILMLRAAASVKVARKRSLEVPTLLPAWTHEQAPQVQPKTAKPRVANAQATSAIEVVDVLVVMPDGGEETSMTWGNFFYDWINGGAAGGPRVEFQVRYIDSAAFYDDEAAVEDFVSPGTVVICPDYGFEDDTTALLGAAVFNEQSRLLSSPRLMRLFGARVPLQIILPADSSCSIEVPAGTHHMVYRAMWCTHYHEQWLASSALEGREDEGLFPSLRSFPFGTSTENGSLANLSADVRPTRERGLLWNYRGSDTYDKLTRKKLIHDVLDDGGHRWSMLTNISRKVMADAPERPEVPDRFLFERSKICDATNETGSIYHIEGLNHVNCTDDIPPASG
jgi:hypothetical protein